VVPQEPLLRPGGLRFRGSPVAGWQGTQGKRFYCFWARNAIFHGLRALGIQPGDKILVPAYICTAAVEPLEYFGAAVEFYAIRRNCAPDWKDLETRITPGVKAILAVHYFGFPCDIWRYRALCEQYGLFLIEDGAHVLEGLPNPCGFGEAGDFSVFSPRKFVPIFDGGVLRLNRPAANFQIRFQSEEPLFTVRVAKNLWERRHPPIDSLVPAPHHGHNHAEAPQAATPAASRPQKPLYVFPNGTAFLPWMADFPMSRLSKHLFRHFPLQEIATKRRENYTRLIEKLRRYKDVRPLHEELGEGVTPWVLPVTIGERADAHTRLRALGIPAVTWGGVRDARIREGDFQETHDLYERLVFLPIHQSLENEDLEKIASAVAAVCGTR